MEELSATLEEVFRREKARVVGHLVHALGNIDAAEEAFQEAVVKALATWPRSGTPASPGAWLTSTARNHVRDVARRRRVADQSAPLLREDEAMHVSFQSVTDDELRLIFTCCHPALTLESQVALTLKVVAGFTTEEIARAFLSPEATVAQRIVRAKRTLEEKQVPYEVPDRSELPDRLAAVLAVIYLIFNEGHTPREGALLQRLDLQREALRLSRLVCDLLPNEPETFGLFSLIALSFSRASTRADEKGELLLLSQQERARWDRPLIKEGLMALERARRLGGQGSHVLQAEISACHATAPAWENTDWRQILRCYDALLAENPSPVIALNRAVALCMLEGPGPALAALAPLEKPLRRYYLFHAMRADFRRRRGEDAQEDYRRALELAGNESERSFLRRQMG